MSWWFHCAFTIVEKLLLKLSLFLTDTTENGGITWKRKCGLRKHRECKFKKRHQHMNVAHITTSTLKTGEELQKNFIWITVNWKADPICHPHFCLCQGCLEASSRDLMPTMHAHFPANQEEIHAGISSCSLTLN